MSLDDQINGIIEARSICAKTLLSVLTELEKPFSEMEVANAWSKKLGMCEQVLPFGWYQPPPNGMSVMLAESKNFDRLSFQSLRDESNWPSSKFCYSDDSILYPYYSAIHRQTSMIGDYVATFYAGRDMRIREWYREVYYLTQRVIDKITFGISFLDIFEIAQQELSQLGAANNTFSLSGGLAADIGHTVPFFGSADVPCYEDSTDSSTLSNLIANGREFISKESTYVIDKPTAFTIEPQCLVPEYPMASFHTIVIVLEDRKLVVEKFRSIFDYFGMSDWLNLTNAPSDLS